MEFESSGLDGEIRKILKTLAGRAGIGSIGIEGMFRERKIKKTIPATKEQIAMHTKLMDMGLKMITETKKIDAMRNQFWAEAQIKMNDYSDMNYNPETKEFEILESAMDSGIKSPYVK